MLTIELPVLEQDFSQHSRINASLDGSLGETPRYNFCRLHLAVMQVPSAPARIRLNCPLRLSSLRSEALTLFALSINCSEGPFPTFLHESPSVPVVDGRTQHASEAAHRGRNQQLALLCYKCLGNSKTIISGCPLECLCKTSCACRLRSAVAVGGHKLHMQGRFHILSLPLPLPD